jgi:hypothetical protein
VQRWEKELKFKKGLLDFKKVFSFLRVGFFEESKQKKEAKIIILTSNL